MKFSPEQKYIAKMLSEEDVRFIIPPYQRPYKWGINECETLWNDILNAFNEGNNKNDALLLLFQKIVITFKLLMDSKELPLLPCFLGHFMNASKQNRIVKKKRGILKKILVNVYGNMKMKRALSLKINIYKVRLPQKKNKKILTRF